MFRRKTGWLVVLLLCMSPAFGCIYKQAIEPENVYTVTMPRHVHGTLIERHAPAFLIYGANKAHNRIGSPSALFEDNGEIRIFVDSEHPVFFVQERTFSTDRGNYLNLIYRIHFLKIPYSMFPFHLTAGKNVGLMVVVTLDESERPVLVTTVHTCGCYAAILPTTYLPAQSLPEDWEERSSKEAALDVYGEKLPWKLDYEGVRQPRLLVHLRPGVHRVMHIEVVEKDLLKDTERFSLVRAPFADIHRLKSLSLDGSATSFYYGKWPLRGHVKGSIKPWESLFLGPISLDLFVGADKIYADKKQSGNPFYTSLRPWNRNKSDMWNFARFLEFYGWRL